MKTVLEFSAFSFFHASLPGVVVSTTSFHEVSYEEHRTTEEHNNGESLGCKRGRGNRGWSKEKA